MTERMQEDSSQHQHNEKTTAEQKREDMQPEIPDTTSKKDGITSSFSAATTATADSQNDMDKIRNGEQQDDEDKTNLA